MELKVKKLDPRAKLPTYATDGSAGLDLYALEDVGLKDGDAFAIRTGIAIEIPPGYEGQIRGRSGLAFKYGVYVPHIGTIDADYRGEIKVLLQCGGLVKDEAAHMLIEAGDRIAQLIIAPVARVQVVESEVLSDTPRGEGGFGSTGT